VFQAIRDAVSQETAYWRQCGGWDTQELLKKAARRRFIVASFHAGVVDIYWHRREKSNAPF